MRALPESARLACWLNAWLDGRVPADTALDGIAEAGGMPGHRAEFAGPLPGTRHSPVELLARLRKLGARRLVVALPVPGDLLGLGGPALFNAAVLDVGEAVVVDIPRAGIAHADSLLAAGTASSAPGLGLVPTTTQTVTTWLLHHADRPGHLPTVREASQALRSAMVEAADALARLDVASWRPDVADELAEIRHPRGRRVDGLPFCDQQAALLCAEAMRAWQIVQAASSDDGGATTADEAAERVRLLRPLDHAARAAICASTSTVSLPPTP